MELTRRTRLEVIVEGALLRRVEATLAEAGVKGWSVFDGVSGAGQHGAWRSEGLSAADRKSMIVALTSRERAEAVLERLRTLFADYPGVAAISEVEVMRGERF